MKERLAKFIKNEELSPSRFAEIMGVPPSSISHLLSGRNNPGFDFLSKMLMRFPKVNPDWLILGTGPMYRTGGIASDVATPSLQAANNTVEITATVPDTAASFTHNGSPSLFNDEPTQLFDRAIPKKPAESSQPEDHTVAGPKPAPTLPDSSKQGVMEGVTVQTAAMPQTLPEQTTVSKCVAKSKSAVEKEIDRIIIFFGDGTFRSYVNSPDGQ